MAKIDKDNIDKFYDYNIDMQGRTIYLGSMDDIEGEESGVDYSMACNLIKGIYLLDRAASAGDKPIKIIMDNPGGSVVDGLAIYDAIKAAKNHVKIIGFGKVWSMAAYIFQAADERVLSPNCSFMFHMGTTGYDYDHPQIIKNWLKFEEKLHKTCNEILLKKIKEKHANFKDKQFDEMNVFDTLLTAQETIDLGLADRILESGELGE